MRTTFLAVLATALLLSGASFAGDDPPSAAELKAAYTEQLLEVLTKTRSTDTFLVTLALLVESKPEPTTVVPIVILQAERLGIFGDHLVGDDGPKAELAHEVKDMILQIQKPGKPGERARYSSPLNRAPVQSYSGAETEMRTPVQPALTSSAAVTRLPREMASWSGSSRSTNPTRG